MREASRDDPFWIRMGRVLQQLLRRIPKTHAGARRGQEKPVWLAVRLPASEDREGVLSWSRKCTRLHLVVWRPSQLNQPKRLDTGRMPEYEPVGGLYVFFHVTHANMKSIKCRQISAAYIEHLGKRYWLFVELVYISRWNGFSAMWDSWLRVLSIGYFC